MNFVVVYDACVLYPAPVVIACAKRIRARLHNPERSAEEYLDTLAAQLPATADKLREFEELI